MDKVEKIADILFNKGFSEDKNRCLEVAAELKELVEKSFSTRIISEKAVENYIKEYKNFRHSIFGNLGKTGEYTGERKVTYTKIRIWAVKDIARVYAEKYVDEHFLNNSYVEVRNPKEKLFDI